MAVRRLNALSLDRDRLRQNFRRQREAPSHEAVVSLLDFQVDASPYLMIQAWEEEARSLSEFPAPRDETAAWRALTGLADGLAHLHKHGAHHGNLHPGNVLVVGDSGTMKVVDAGPGLAGRVYHIDLGEAAWYAPPEQLENPERWEDGGAERWDVYRFGVIAYAWLNGVTPRGGGYRRARENALAESGGRPVGVDIAALAEDMRQTVEVTWKEGSDLSRENRLRREIVDRCLSLDPRERPVDMREVAAAFEALETRFEREASAERMRATIIEAEERVSVERTRQAATLRRTRLVAASLLVMLLVTALFLVRYHQRSRGYENRASELDLVVRHQRSQLEESDRRLSQSRHELRTTREAADSVFSQLGKFDPVSSVVIPPEGSIERENLEKSREFFLDALAEAADDPARELERLRNWHNLAHVELHLGLRDEARSRLESAIAQFERLIAERGAETTVVHEAEARLADCHETLVGLVENDPSDELRAALTGASRYLERMAERRSDDHGLARRRLSVDFRLARQHFEHGDYVEALVGYVSLGHRLEAMRAVEPESAALRDMIGEIQFHTARPLREEGRDAEAVAAYLAALETLGRVDRGRAHSDEECLRLASVYLDLGDLLSREERTPAAEIEEVYNEALRLVSPVAFRQPHHLETAVLFARVTARIGMIERESGRWTDGYRSSLAGIEKLEAALENSPEDLEARLTLVEMRVEHVRLLKYQKAVAMKCLGKGIEMAHLVHDEIDSEITTWPRGVRKIARVRLAAAFQAYGEMCREMGDAEQAESCFERANRAKSLLVRSEVGNPEVETVTF